MMKYKKHNIKDVSLEEAHGGSGSRQVLVNQELLANQNFEAMTKGYLNPGFSYDWHSHDGIDEIMLVIKGVGKFYWEEDVMDYKEGDIITIPANSRHKVEATGGIQNEFYFIR